MDGAVRVMTEQSLEVLRFYHLKELACDATIASMFLILYDTGRFFYIFFCFEVSMSSTARLQFSPWVKK